MRHFAVLFISLLAFFTVSCEKETILIVNPSALSFEKQGGITTTSVVANKVWQASSTQSWCKVSPAVGDGSDNSNFTLTVSCDENNTYDPRSCTITITCEELTKTIIITQAEGQGLLVSQQEFNLTNEEQTISIDIQTNVQYTVDIDAACRDWIKQNSTKALSSSTIKFDISKNEAYDGREGKITIKQSNGSLSAIVVVKQSQTNGLFVDQTVYNVSYEEQQLNIKVKSNINYEVEIDDSCKDWISRVGTKGLTESTVTLAIAINQDVEREGKVVLEYGDIQETVIIQQGGGFIEFEDKFFNTYCLKNFDKNGDGNVSFKEAAEVTEIEIRTNKIASLQGIEFFTNLSSLRCTGLFNSMLSNYEGQLTALDISKNTKLAYLDCSDNQLITLDVSNNTELAYLSCDNNLLTVLNVSKNSELQYLSCRSNHLSALDVSKNMDLTYLYCYDNQLITLDVSHNIELTFLHCANNQLTTLNVSKNTALTCLNCDNNQLTVLDVSKNTELTDLYCSDNQLTTLDVSHNTELACFQCYNNQLTTFNISKNTKLAYLSCDNNLLTALDVSKNIVLICLYCSDNQLITLDVSNNTDLTELYCPDNQLITLDVSHNIELMHLMCFNNQLTSLDVSHNTALEELWCFNNPSLTEIWLKTGQVINNLSYDASVATIKYKD